MALEQELELHWRRNLRYIAAACFLVSVGFNLISPFIPMFIMELGQHENVATLSSIAMSATSLMAAIMAPVWGSLADKYGKKVMFLRAGTGLAISNMLIALSQNFWQFLALRLLNGFLSGFIPASIMFIATNTPERRVGLALGINQSATSIGTIMGPALGGYLAAQFGMRFSMGVAAVLILIASLLAIFGSKELVLNTDRSKRTDVIGDMKAVMSDATLRGVIFAMFLVNMSISVIQPVLALYIATMPFEGNLEVVTGYVFSVIGISTAIGAPLISRLHTRVAPKMVFFYGLALGALLYTAQGMTNSVLMLGGQRFLFGFANSAITITANVLVTGAASAEMRGRTFGALNGIASLGNVAGPLMGGTIGDAAGYNMAFFMGTGLFMLALGITRSSLKDVGNKPIEA